MDRGPKGIKVSFLKQHEGGGQEALHVGCATSGQPPAYLREGVGVGGPAGSGGNHVGVTRQQNPARSVRTEAEVQVGPPHLARHHVKFGTSPMGSICVVVDQVDVGRATFRGVRH